MLVSSPTALILDPCCCFCCYTLSFFRHPHPTFWWLSEQEKKMIMKKKMFKILGMENITHAFSAFALSTSSTSSQLLLDDPQLQYFGMAAVGHNSLEASSSSSSSTKTQERKKGPQIQNDAVFEQRRVRHITSILLRNVRVPSSTSSLTSSSTPLLHRPKARRSISTASTSSASTIRRVPSVKSLSNKSRGRASSISSIYQGNVSLDDDSFLQSDLTALRRQVESRLCHTFITLSRQKIRQEIYRSSTSGQSGINFEWGRAPGSICDIDDFPLDRLEGDMGSEEDFCVTVWYKRKDANDKGKAREEQDPNSIYVEPGSETQSGWSILWQQNVYLRKLSKLMEDPSTSTLSFQPNSLLFGLSFPLAQVQSIRKGEDDESLDQTKVTGLQGRSKVTSDTNRGAQVQYYIASSNSSNELKEVESLTEEVEERSIIQARLKSGELVRGYQIEDILRLLQMQRELYHHYAEVWASQAHSDRMLESVQGPIKKEFYASEEEEKLTVLRQERDAKQDGTKEKRKLVQERVEAINRRRARLEVAKRAMTKERFSYQGLQNKLLQLNRQCQLIRAKAYARRVVLLQQVEFIYPIELVDGVTLLFSIVDVPLANRVLEDESQRLEGENDDIVSSALGFIGQVVGLVSVYMDTPIHYPIATAGSRSIIQDGISVMTGPRIFPLYSKGVERYRFDYAIFLLNKDIEQLMNNFGITVLDIRNTLPNLKNLIVTLSASSHQVDSRLSRRNLVGSEMISLKADKEVKDSQSQKVITTISDQLHHHHHQQELEGEKMSRSNWGKSLLGWGNNGHSRPSSSASISQLPTVRSIGSSK